MLGILGFLKRLGQHPEVVDVILFSFNLGPDLDGHLIRYPIHTDEVTGLNGIPFDPFLNAIAESIRIFQPGHTPDKGFGMLKQRSPGLTQIPVALLYDIDNTHQALMAISFSSSMTALTGVSSTNTPSSK